MGICEFFNGILTFRYDILTNKKKNTIIFVFLYIDLDFKFANYACPEIVDGSVNIDRDSHST